jgi:hypothetical protein
MVRSGTFLNTNGTVLPRETFWLKPPCCLHLSDGMQVGDATKKCVGLMFKRWPAKHPQPIGHLFNYNVIFVPNM